MPPVDAGQAIRAQCLQTKLAELGIVLDSEEALNAAFTASRNSPIKSAKFSTRLAGAGQQRRIRG